jgi:hypothetical protein
VQLEAGEFHITRRTGGVATIITMIPALPSDGQPYRIRFQAIGQMLQAKYWPALQSEPNTWISA